MGFSSILDISSFFIGMIINLIFVALMCYYFKRKYDYLEIAQNEQAKILYQLIHKPMSCQLPSCPPPSMNYANDPLLKPIFDSDSDSESESESEVELEVAVDQNVVLDEGSETLKMEFVDLDDTKTVELNQSQLSVEEVKPIETLDISIQLDSDTNYSKMSMKQLKDVLSSKGIKAKNNMKKDELLELITNEIKA